MSSLAATPNPNPPSPIRLFNPPMGSQVSWVLPLALFGLFSTAWRRRPPTAARSRSRRRLNRRQRSFVLWGTWAVSAGAVFSIAQGISPYYLAELAPAICALAAVGIYGLWRDYRSENGIRGWLLPVALFATAVEHWYLLSSVPTWLPWLPITLLGVTLGLSLVLALRRIPPRRWMPLARLRDRGARWESPIAPAFAALGLVVLFLTPTLWTLGSLRNANAGGHPVSGPTRRGAEIAPPPLADPILILYLRAHAEGTRFLVATVTTGDATPIIFSTGAPVMAMGGFSGSDPILSVQNLRDAVRSETVEVFWLPSANLSANQVRAYFPLVKSPPPTKYTNALTGWVSQTCAVVPPIESMLLASPRQVPSRVLFVCP